MIHYVVDASVAIKWFVAEVHSNVASRLIDPGLLLWAPDLIRAELGNALWKKVKRGELSQDEGRRLAGRLGALAVRIISAEFLIAEAYELAMELNRTVYDSLYLAVAVQRQIQLVTADLRFHNAIKASRHAGRSLWIEDVP